MSSSLDIKENHHRRPLDPLMITHMVSFSNIVKIKLIIISIATIKTKGIDEGTYALCDARLLRDENDRCELSQTVTIPLGRVAQFQFWYHMYGFQIGTLELLADDVVLWSLTGRQADQWRLAQVVLPDGKYEVNF